MPTKPKKTESRTSSTNGTTPTAITGETEIKPFTSLDICNIIESCATHKVSTLKCLGLEIDFGTPPKSEPEVESNPPGPLSHISQAPVAAITEPEVDHVKNMKDAIEDAELSAREEEIAMATIENPGLAEQLLMDGELEDADSEPADDE